MAVKISELLATSFPSLAHAFPATLGTETHKLTLQQVRTLLAYQADEIDWNATNVDAALTDLTNNKMGVAESNQEFVSRVEAFGLGVNAPLIGNAGVTNGSIKSGLYRYDATAGVPSSGGPATVTKGSLIHVQTAGFETQDLVVAEGSGATPAGSRLARFRVGGAWSAWDDGVATTVQTPTAYEWLGGGTPALNQATIDCVFDKTRYCAIDLIFSQLQGTAEQTIGLQVGNDAGSSFDTTNYTYNNVWTQSTTTATGQNNTTGSATWFALAPFALENASGGGGLSGSVRIVGPGEAGRTSCMGITNPTDTTTDPAGLFISGRKLTVGTHGSARLIFLSGNFKNQGRYDWIGVRNGA